MSYSRRVCFTLHKEETRYVVLIMSMTAKTEILSMTDKSASTVQIVDVNMSGRTPSPINVSLHKVRNNCPK